MIYLERSFDRFFVREMITHKGVWPFVHCDGVDRNTYQPPDLNENIALFAHVNGIWCGGWVFRKTGIGSVEVHTCLFKPITTKEAVEAGKRACQWLKENEGIEYMTSLVPINNPRALWYALKVGFNIAGTIADSFLKDGVMLDQTIVEKRLCQ